MNLIWHNHRSIGDYLPATISAWPYVITRLPKRRFKLTVTLSHGTEHLGRFVSAKIAKLAAQQHENSQKLT